MLTVPVIAIPYWSSQHIILTWRTGPILLCPPIHATKFGIWTITRQCILSACSSRTSQSIIHMVNSFEVLSEGDYSSWIPQIRRLELFLSHLTILQIFDDEYAVGHPLLEHSSLVFTPKCSLLAVPTFVRTDRSPSRRISPCFSADWPGISWVNSSHQFATAP